MEFKTELAKNIFNHKYANFKGQTWNQKVQCIVEDVIGDLMEKDDVDFLQRSMEDFKFLPGGRYIYYAGKAARYYNNCFLLRGEEDTREEWSDLSKRSMSCLMTGGGIGIDYSVFRPCGSYLNRTGGEASGPIPLMNAINEIGRNVRQGGSRRSAIYASLIWNHADAAEFLKAKNWHDMNIGDSGISLADAKKMDFNFNAPLDMTNISLNYDDEFLNLVRIGEIPEIFKQNVKQAVMTGEPGFSFNFGSKQRETLRNACTEVTSEDDSDVCNLGSINMGSIDTIGEFRDIVRVSAMFLVAGTLVADLPYQKVYEVREKNRRLGLGLMGIHEWLLKRGCTYGMNDELRKWLEVYEEESELAADAFCAQLGISSPVAYRAIAPTGTIGILASTTTGIEPLFATAYKRRYLQNKTWKYEYVVDGTTKLMVDQYKVDPDSIETASSLQGNPEARVEFQADVQDYVDMGISSTINLPKWGTANNNEDKVEDFVRIISNYAHRLRGLTCYPDGSRGGQPITPISYKYALKKEGVVFEENQESQCISGVCGV